MADLSELSELGALPEQQSELGLNTYDEIFIALLANKPVKLLPLSRPQVKKLRTALLTRMKEYNKMQVTFGEEVLKKVVGISLDEKKTMCVVQLLEQKPVAEGITIIQDEDLAELSVEIQTTSQELNNIRISQIIESQNQE